MTSLAPDQAEDVPLGEDASRLHLVGVRQVAAGLRHLSQFPERAVTLVVDPFPTHA